jgi:hypothetical protein
MDSVTTTASRTVRQPKGQRLQLRDVTVCVADTLTPALAARALEICLDQCDFGDAILFSDTAVEGRFRNVAIPRLTSVGDYSLFCLRDMPGHITTDFALIVQWDGYIANTSAWTAAFRKYDYIGAPIPSNVGGPPIVGNGGFSRRSRALLGELPSLPFVANLGEDWIISSVMRRSLEKAGIRFAPVELAERFSHEVRRPTRPTFGFHGMPNLALYESDDDVVAILSALPRPQLVSRVYFVLLFNCLRDGRTRLANALYPLVRAGREPEWLVGQMARWSPAETARDTIAELEKAYGETAPASRTA